MKAETEKILRYVGLCKRAGGVVRGAESIEKILHRKPAPVCVIIAADASGRTVTEMQRKCENAGVLWAQTDADKYDLAKTIGATSPCAAVAVMAGKGPARVVAEMLRQPQSNPVLL